MPRSTTVWAAALVLASFSGSGPLLTTAEAMPAPGPQQTQGRPRYYFPRHVKRQIVTNSTAPAAPTLSSSTTQSTSQLESRQGIDISSALKSIFDRPDLSSSLQEASSDLSRSTGTVTSIQDIIVTPVPDVSDSRPGSGTGTGTGNPRPSEAPRPTPSPQRPNEEEPPSVLPPILKPSSASGGLLPEIIVPASSSVVSSVAPASSAVVEQPTPSAVESIPTPTPSSSAPAGGFLSSLLGGLLGTTGGPIPILQPTPTPAASSASATPELPSASATPEAPSASARPSNGGILESILPILSSVLPVLPVPESSATPQPIASSVSGPFIIPGSTGAGIPSPVVQPTPSQDPLGGLLSSILDPVVGPTGILPVSPLQPTPAPASQSEAPSFVIQPSSGGIVVGITTALGTGAPLPTPVDPIVSSAVIPTSETVLPSNPIDLTPILSSVLSELPGVLPSGSAGPTDPAAPTPTPAPEPSGILPPIVSSLASDVSSILASAVPEVPGSVVPSIVSSLMSELPTPTGGVPLPASSIVSSILSEISSNVVPTPSGMLPSPTDIVPTPSGIFPSPSDGLPTPSGSVPTPSETASVSVGIPTPSETLVPSSSGISQSGVSESPVPTPSGISPSAGTGTGLSPIESATSAPEPSSVPASEGLSGTPSSQTITDAASATPVPSTPVSTPSVSEAPTPVESSSRVFVTSTPPPAVQSQRPTGSDSASSLVVGPSIIMEPTPSSGVSPSATAPGIPSGLPKMISPPSGVPPAMPADSFLGQVCFKWQLNYNFVSQNDAGRQIFHFLPIAIANALNISTDDVHNIGLKPLDTTKEAGFITTTAVFAIPKDLANRLQAQLRNPADPFWRNSDSTVNELTALINTACPLPAGRLPGDPGAPNQAGVPGSTTTGGAGDGGVNGNDIGKSQPINKSSAGIAAGAIAGAIAYGAAMFFVARRYRNKRIAHQRASSVPSTGSRMTYGSIPGGAAAWMHGARNGRMTPASRGSSSSQGQSVRTQQISAPVMAENSLGWN